MIQLQYQHVTNSISYRQEESLTKLQMSFGYPESSNVNMFVWCLVSLHRRIALGLNIPDSHLGSWIWQYGKHIHACGMPHTPAPFNYDPNLNYGGRAITYRELTAWIMNPKFSTVSKEYAQRWDLAIEALIDHNRHRSDFHWAAFRAKLLAAKTPFW